MVEKSKYDDRDLQGIFGRFGQRTEDIPSETPEMRTERLHHKRDSIKNGGINRSADVDEILRKHRLLESALPVPLAKSAADRPPAVTPEKMMHDVLDRLPAVRRFEDAMRRGETRWKLGPLQTVAVQEARSNQGYSPPELSDATKRQLVERHGIPPEEISSGFAGINNGSSAYILVGAITGIKGRDILTQEYHWDGYDKVIPYAGHNAREVPRDVPIRKYIEDRYGRPDEFRQRSGDKVGALLITNPCSITGKELRPDELRDLLKIVKDYNISLIFNEIHAGPSANGNGFSSITRLPEYQEVKDKILIVGSITKTANIPNAVPKTSYFFTADKQWGQQIMTEVSQLSRPFDNEDKSRILSYLQGVGPQYWLENERAYSKNRDIVDQWMEKINKGAGSEAVKWLNGHPDKGYMASIEFSPSLLKKAEIHDTQELFEYLYTSTGVNTAEVMPSIEKKSALPIAVRVNYALEERQLNLGMDLLEAAMKKMEKGVTLRQVRNDPAKRRLSDPFADLFSGYTTTYQR